MVDIESLELDLENPRISRILAMYNPETINSETIALALGAGETKEGDTYATFRNLKESIRTNGGLIHPIIANKQADGKVVVIEGNTRLLIFRQFIKEDVDGNWNTIPTIINEGMGDIEINAIRLQAHLVGPRPWDPYSKAKYLHTLSTEKHMTTDMIVEYCGGKRKQVIEYIQAYKDMETYYRPKLENDNDFDPTRFSAFVELQGNRIELGLVNGNHNKEDFAQWVISGLFSPLNTVRCLPKILQNSGAKKVFLKDGAKLADLHLSSENKTPDATLGKCSLKDLANESHDRIATMPWQEVRRMKADPNDEVRYALESLRDQLEDILADMN